MPTKNGEIIAASAVVPYASPTCSTEKRSVEESHGPIVTDHAPHTKYCKNIMVESLRRVVRITLFPLCQRLSHVCEAFLHFFDRSSGAAMLVLDESPDGI